MGMRFTFFPVQTWQERLKLNLVCDAELADGNELGPN